MSHAHELVSYVCFVGSVAGVPYNVSVAAVNRAGHGRFNDCIKFTMEQGEFIIIMIGDVANNNNGYCVSI
jgi:hypothetical protein